VVVHSVPPSGIFYSQTMPPRECSAYHRPGTSNSCALYEPRGPASKALDLGLFMSVQFVYHPGASPSPGVSKVSGAGLVFLVCAS
jgi:hypothetical protein